MKKVDPNISEEELLRLVQEGKIYIEQNVRTCACCGKEITAGYVWDGTDTFCSKECAAKALDNDMGCVEILLDDGRLEWQEEFNENE